MTQSFKCKQNLIFLMLTLKPFTISKVYKITSTLPKAFMMVQERIPKVARKFSSFQFYPTKKIFLWKKVHNLLFNKSWGSSSLLRPSWFCFLLHLLGACTESPTNKKIHPPTPISFLCFPRDNAITMGFFFACAGFWHLPFQTFSTFFYITSH